jgi:U3 small nucleolar RNA-associated protein 3
VRREQEREKAKEIEEAREKKRKEKEGNRAAKDEARRAHLESVEQERQAKEKDIVRNVNYAIMKSKGITRKRKKIDRNPRVKHREKYRKALQKRKSKVQEFKEGPQGKYGGESSGFKTGLIRSTKLS